MTLGSDSPIKPRALKSGSTLAVVSPSWGGPATFPAVFDAGCRVLEKLGFRVIEYPSARATAEELDRFPQKRAKDFHTALVDPTVDGIVASIGGNDSVRILRYLDVDLFLRNPKLILGHSDATTFLSWLSLHGLTTFYGNSVMSGFAQLERFPHALEWYRRFLTGEPVELRPFPVWTNGERNWDALDRAIPELPNSGPKWLQGKGATRGRLYGGCFEVLEMLKATPYWPNPSFWQGKVLFLETSEEKPSPRQVLYWLRNYGAQGIFSKLSALWIGRPKDYTEAESKELHRVVVGIVAQEWDAPHLPIVADLDFGHTDPRWILPYGIEVETDCTRKTVKFLEPAFSRDD